MPWLARKRCIEPNCDAPAAPGSCRCERHKAMRDQMYARTQERTERAALYASPMWKAVRRAVLIERPFCVECMKQGRYTPAEVVDHIRPHKGDAQLFFDTTNLQPLCKACHDRKTASEDGGFGRDFKTGPRRG